MIVNIVIGALIFGYAAWTLIRYVKKTKQGRCAACAMNQSCATPCSTATQKSE